MGQDAFHKWGAYNHDELVVNHFHSGWLPGTSLLIVLVYGCLQVMQHSFTCQTAVRLSKCCIEQPETHNWTNRNHYRPGSGYETRLGGDDFASDVFMSKLGSYPSHIATVLYTQLHWNVIPTCASSISANSTLICCYIHSVSDSRPRVNA